MKELLLGILSSIAFAILTYYAAYLGFQEWFFKEIAERPLLIFSVFIGLILIGYILACIIFIPYYKGKLESQTAKSKFTERLVDRRLNALLDIRKTLNDMITFEDINLLKTNCENDVNLEETTISLFHGLNTFSEHCNALATNLLDYGEDLPISLRAPLTAFSQFQFELGLLYRDNFGIDKETDYYFAISTLPVAEDVKNYIRKIDDRICKQLNKPSFSMESSYGLIWKIQFSRYKSMTAKMIQIIKLNQEILSRTL